MDVHDFTRSAARAAVREEARRAGLSTEGLDAAEARVARLLNKKPSRDFPRGHLADLVHAATVEAAEAALGLWYRLQ